MIKQLTIGGIDYYIEGKGILYAYDNSGLNLVLNQNKASYSPEAEMFENNVPNAISFPTYANFVSENSVDFLELTHSTLTNICINLRRVLRLQEIDSSNTLIQFDNLASVEVNESLSVVQTAINERLTPGTYVSEDLDSDGSGIITLANNYRAGSWNLFIRGVLVRKAEVTESGPNELTISADLTEAGDFINVNYLI